MIELLVAMAKVEADFLFSLLVEDAVIGNICDDTKEQDGGNVSIASSATETTVIANIGKETKEQDGMEDVLLTTESPHNVTIKEYYKGVTWAIGYIWMMKEVLAAETQAKKQVVDIAKD